MPALALLMSQNEIEQVLIAHWLALHGFDLKSFTWDKADDGTVQVACAAEVLAQRKAPAPAFEIDETMVRRILGDIIGHASPPPPAAAPLPVQDISIAAALAQNQAAAQPLPAFRDAKTVTKDTVRTAQGNVLSWVDHPDEAPRHPSDTQEKIAERREKLLAVRREAGGVFGTDSAEEPFDPRKPPPGAQLDKH